MPSLLTHQSERDHVLWEQVCRDDRGAFEELVKRHQSAVAAVAFSSCGDLALSEDIAQETFWAAWRERASLLEPTRVRAWLCGIARNLAKNSLRRTRPATSLDDQAEPVAAASEPVDEAASREELDLVRQTLEAIPDTYREPLVLFYREQQSVAEVAASLDLTPDAVKQRLSRGREYLREQIAEVVQRTLQGTRPRAGFTAGVMAGLTALSVGSQAAIAGSGIAVGTGTALKGTSAATVLAAGSASGVIGGLIGTVAGLFGGWLGMFIPAQLAPTNRERELLQRTGQRLFIGGLIATLAILGLMGASLVLKLSGALFATLLIGGIIALQAHIWIETALTARAVRRIRAEMVPGTDVNTTQLAAAARDMASRWEGRRFRSSVTLLGLPLIDIQVSDPGAMSMSLSGGSQVEKARGWIAIGDRADGILLAVGGVARGLIAIGGLAIGGLSFGGLAIGLFAFGGGAIGAVAFGGVGIGGIAFGGGAIGWQACGGGAFGWDVAVGGGALAYHAAYGGGALAHELAVGGGASAIHANDEVAKQFFEGHWMVEGMARYQAHIATVTVAIILASLFPALAMHLVMYRRKSLAETSHN